MELYQPLTARTQPLTAPLKDSIRDMIRLQRDYQLSDEVFWEVFNTRVLLNEPIDVSAFVRDFHEPMAQA